MELRQLSMFKMLATTLSFTHTAAALGYVQSNVSAQIQALEEELGTPLVDRLGKQIALTDAGQRFLPYVEQVLTLVEEARMAVSGKDEPMGTLTISAPETLCTYRLPHLLSSFQQCYPQVRLLFRPCPVAELRQQVSGSNQAVCDGPDGDHGAAKDGGGTGTRQWAARCSSMDRCRVPCDGPDALA
jgi:DNA-binding transcriptional LysR family regulator